MRMRLRAGFGGLRIGRRIQLVCGEQRLKRFRSGEQRLEQRRIGKRIRCQLVGGKRICGKPVGGGSVELSLS